MNYKKNYLTAAGLLDGEMEQFNNNPAAFVAAMSWGKESQEQAEQLKDKLTLVKKDYVGLEKLIDSLEKNNPHFEALDIIESGNVSDYITNLFAGKITKAIKNLK